MEKITFSHTVEGKPILPIYVGFNDPNNVVSSVTYKGVSIWKRLKVTHL